MKRAIFSLWWVALATNLPASEGDIIHVGQKAPEVTGVTSEGARLEAESFKGKVVLLDFFATWCGPCMQEMPHVEREIWQKYKADGLMVIGVGREHTVDQLKKFKDSKRFTFTMLSDPKREIYGRYASQYIPRCYLIGKDGVVKYAAMGWDPAEFEKMKAAVEAELKR